MFVVHHPLGGHIGRCTAGSHHQPVCGVVWNLHTLQSPRRTTGQAGRCLLVYGLVEKKHLIKTVYVKIVMC